MAYPRSNLTPYDWACVRVEFMRNRLHVDEWITTVAQLAVMLFGFWLVKEYTQDSDLLAGLGGFAVFVGAGIFKHYTLKKARAEFDKAEQYRDQLFFEEDER